MMNQFGGWMSGGMWLWTVIGVVVWILLVSVVGNALRLRRADL
jgi:hypothetical protein